MSDRYEGQTYYEILEVKPTAGPADIYAAYQKARATYSPSSPALYSMFSPEEAQELMALIEEAYQTLSHQARRKEYDSKIGLAKPVGKAGVPGVSASAASYAASVREAKNSVRPMASKVEHNAAAPPPSKNDVWVGPVRISAKANDLPGGFARTKFTVYEVKPDIEREIESVTECDGLFLQKIRLYRGVTLDQMSDEIRVIKTTLVALEANDVEALPVAVFTRGFVVQFARALGLNERQISDAYMKFFKAKKSLSSESLHTFIVGEEHAGIRLDKFLTTLTIIASRTRATELIDRGLVTINGKTLKPAYKLPALAEITIRMPAPEPSELQPLDAPLEILFEDSDVVVVNKPSGLVVHPAAGHAQDTLVNILLHHVGSLSMGFGEQRPGIVHRLDRDTSGILVVAKNDSAHRSLSDQFRNKTAHRMYHALVHGTMKKKFGTFTTHLARDPKYRQRFASTGTDQGKIAITHFEVLQTVPAHLSLIQCRLETGRTHQIRVHLSEAGHPLVGDVIYGNRSQKKPADRDLGRLGLHAVELGFKHPRTHEAMFFKKEWPEQMAVFARAKGFRDV